MWLRPLPRTSLPLRPGALLGVEALRHMDAPVSTPTLPVSSGVPAAGPGLGGLIESIAASGRGVILTMGKGGVGKTTIAAAIAVELAHRGLRVRLSTTDPAAHVADTVSGPLPGLTLSRIDPAAETRAYTAEVMGSVGPQLDDKGRALLEEYDRLQPEHNFTTFETVERAWADIVTPKLPAFRPLDSAPCAWQASSTTINPYRSARSMICCTSAWRYCLESASASWQYARVRSELLSVSGCARTSS